MRDRARWSGIAVGAFVGASAVRCGGVPPGQEVASTAQAVAGDSLPGLTAAQQSAFAEGKDAFNEVETVADGLGPVFNEKSCGSCHNISGIAGAAGAVCRRPGPPA